MAANDEASSPAASTTTTTSSSSPLKLSGSSKRPSITSTTTTTSSSSPLKLSGSSKRPSITLPPRSSPTDTFFPGGLGFSPGPMTLVSNFFSENDPFSDCRSFTQLLSGAVTSPPAASANASATTAAGGGGGGVAERVSLTAVEESGDKIRSGGGGELGFRFQQNRPTGLLIGQSHMFTIPPGLSPACLLDSPNLFPSVQGSYGMSRQQTLSQVTSQTAQTHSQIHQHPLQSEYQPSAPAQFDVSVTQSTSLNANTTTHQQMPRLESVHEITRNNSSEYSNTDQRSYSSTVTADKPADDGYNWRKYGQKHVKGSEFPRSYYKCTHSNCPVTKKVERSLEGHVTEIIYKGQHTHDPPQSNKRTKGTGHSNGITGNTQSHLESSSHDHTTNLNRLKGINACSSKMDQEYSHSTLERTGSSDNEEVGDAETRTNNREEDDRDPKRRISDVKVSEPVSSHKTITEPRIIVQTTSEVDLLDDGYRWRKYGQKVVKGNPYPRSYYKCTTPGCTVRKHVERAASDPKAVITTYEGKHNHDVPLSRNSSHNTANSNSSQARTAAKQTNTGGNHNQRPVAVLRLKEEEIT